MAGLFNTGKQVQSPAPVRLTVAPVAQTAALRPVQRQDGSNARALAEALGSLNGSLARYAEVDRAIKEDPESRANREWIAKRWLMSADELTAEMESEGPNMSNIQRDASEALIAEKATTNGRVALTEFFNTGFDYQNGDPAAEADRILAEEAEGLPGDVAKAAFYKNMAGFRQAWVDKAHETKLTDVKQQVSSAIVDGFRNTIDSAQAQGKSASEVAGMLFERSASNRTFLGLSGQEQNETLLGVAEEAAQRGDVDLVRALLNGSRTGAKGEALPSLMKIAGLSSKGTRLMDIARSRQTETIERESYPTYQTMNTQVAEGSFTAKEAEPLIRNGTLTAKAAAAKVSQSDANRAQIQNAEAKKQRELAYVQANERQRAEVLAGAAHELETYAGVTNIHDVEIVSKTGEGTQKITKKELVDAAIGRKEQELQDKREKLIQGGSSAEDADLVVNRDRVSFYAANGLDNSAWDMQFNSIAGMVGVDPLSKGGAPAKQVTDIAELYLQVRASNPAYAEGLVSDPRAKEWLEVYDVERNITRLPADRAALSAASWVSKPETEKARFRIKDSERDTIANDAMSGQLDGWFTSGETDGPNYALVRGKVEQLSRKNLPKSVIQQRTEEWIKSSTVAVNGVLIETKGRTPADFKEVSEEYLSDLQNRNAEKWGLEDEADGDLFLVPTPSGGRWFIWSKTLDVPLGTLGVEQLGEVRQKFQKEKAQKAVEIAFKADAKRAEWGRRKKAEQDQAAQLRRETQEALVQRFGPE